VSATLPPRAVVVTRVTDYEALLRQHGTREQARFFLSTRGQTIEEVEGRHRVQVEAVEKVAAAIPTVWRRARVSRPDLDRFSFDPEDVVIAVGQDGLVANVAKYLSGQVVVGVNPSQSLYEGVLVKHAPDDVGDLLREAVGESPLVESRSLVEATTSDGQRLLALNEVFLGHERHQSARYVICHRGSQERQSSSGVIVATGTGSTGWARSIVRSRERKLELPAPTQKLLAFFVREAFPSANTGVAIDQGVLSQTESLEVTSEMSGGGVLFGDGIEEDRIELHFGQRVKVRVADVALRLLAA
jgi:NAD kinase